MTGYVYRIYDRNDQLLWIGHSRKHPKIRIQGIKTTVSWREEIKRYEVVEHINLWHARMDERLSIFQEQPKHNVLNKKALGRVKKKLEKFFPPELWRKYCLARGI